MTLQFQRRLEKVETRRRQTALTDMTDAELNGRIRWTIAQMLRTSTMAELRAEMVAFPSAAEVFDEIEAEETPHATH